MHLRPEADFDEWLNATGLVIELAGVLLAAARFVLFESQTRGKSRGVRLSEYLAEAGSTSGAFGVVPANVAHGVLVWGSSWTLAGALCLLAGLLGDTRFGLWAFLILIVVSVAFGLFVIGTSRWVSGNPVRMGKFGIIWLVVLTWLPVLLVRFTGLRAPFSWLAARPREGGVYGASRLERAVGAIGRNLETLLAGAVTLFAFGIVLELLAALSHFDWR